MVFIHSINISSLLNIYCNYLSNNFGLLDAINTDNEMI